MDRKSVKMTNSVVAEQDTNGSHALNNHLKSLKNRKSISNHQTAKLSETMLCSNNRCSDHAQSKKQQAPQTTVASTNASNQTKQSNAKAYHKETRLTKVHSIEAINYNVGNLAGKFDKLNQPNHAESAIRRIHGM